MTEAEWQSCDDPTDMLLFLRGPDSLREEVVNEIFIRRIEVDAPGLTSQRKLRLAACACCRRIEHLLHNIRNRELIEVNEQFADGEASAEQLRLTHDMARDALGSLREGLYHEAAVVVLGLREWLHAELFRAMREVVGKELSESFAQHELTLQCELIRCVAGNPSRPVAFDPAWRTETVVALAAGIYAERAFDRLPILADALEEAGGDHPNVLAHCRGPGPHARGCWVVDLVLQKS